MAPPARTPQAVRRARTRALLIDACLESLVELGYAGTTTSEVARRAGVSRGAQLHHFPTKAELVSAAIEHIYEQRMQSFRDAMDRASPDADRVELGIDLLWSMFEGTAATAWVELAVAARTDDQLRVFTKAMSEKHRSESEAMLKLYFSDYDQGLLEGVASKYLFALFDGLTLHRFSEFDEAPGRAEAVVRAAKAIAVKEVRKRADSRSRGGA